MARRMLRFAAGCDADADAAPLPPAGWRSAAVRPPGTEPVLLPSSTSSVGLKRVRKRSPTNLGWSANGTSAARVATHWRGPPGKWRYTPRPRESGGGCWPRPPAGRGRPAEHFFGQAAVPACQHELDPGDQDVGADAGYQGVLPDGGGAAIPAALEVLDGGLILLVQRRLSGGGRNGAEV